MQVLMARKRGHERGGDERRTGRVGCSRGLAAIYASAATGNSEWVAWGADPNNMIPQGTSSYHNWEDRARIFEVPADERATLKVQLTEIKEALEWQIAQLEILGDEQPLSAAQADLVEPCKANDPNSGPEHTG